ncbi:MAG: permease, partial [Ilumatobacter fluminis]
MIRDTLWLLIELTVLFFGVAFIIHLFQRRFGAERLRAWMGGTPLMSAVKGIAVGFVTPFCTYSAIPMLVGFRQAGVPPAGYVAFITAAPVLDPVLFGALVVIVGPQAALIYTAVAFGAAITIALVAQRSDLERHLKPIPQALAAPTRH